MAWVARLPRGTNCQHDQWIGGVLGIMFGHARCFSTAERSWYVSTFGRCRDTRGRLTCGSLHPMGYRVVFISGHRFLVHRIVAFAFLGPPTEELAWQVHHKDGDGLNNRLDNLSYVTSSQNVQSSYRCNSSRGNASASISKPVIWRNLAKSHEWNTCPSIITAAKVLGLSRSTVVRCCLEGIPTGDFQIQFAPPAEPDCLPGEIWLPMRNPSTGHVVNGREVSSLGRIKSCNGLVTLGRSSRSGYFSVDLRQDWQCRKVMVHRLVAYAFLGPPPSPGHTQVNHKDLNPSNNWLENLEYVTPSENIRHFHSTVRFPLRKPGAHIPVLARPYGSNGSFTKYQSIVDASKVLGISAASISKCSRGLLRQAGTYEFRRAETSEPEHFHGEEWRAVDVNGLLKDRASRAA